MEKILCKKCNNQLKIREGDYLFSFNINCCNNHIENNVDLEDLLSQTKYIQEKNECKEHNKKKKIHCFDCDEDICFICFNKLHKNYKIEYLHALSPNEIFIFNYKEIIKKRKHKLDAFLSELVDFQNKLNLYIDILKKQIKKYHELQCKLIDYSIENDCFFIDIENTKNFLGNESYKFIDDYSGRFVFSRTFIEKYDYLKKIFELLFKKGKYIEQMNIINIYNKFNYNYIVPLDKNYFISYYNQILSIIKNKSDSHFYDFPVILQEKLGYHIQEIILKKNNKDIEKELSFLMLEENEYSYKTSILEATITSLKENNFQYKIVKTFDSRINLFSLDEKKNLVFLIKETPSHYNHFINEKSLNNEIFLYDDLFKNGKLIAKFSGNAYNILKIKDDVLVFINNINNHLNIMRIEEFFSDINETNIYCESIISYNEKKKILFTQKKNNIYLVNFNLVIPEINQIFEINSLSARICHTFIKIIEMFNDDFLFLEEQKEQFIELNFYEIKYIVQYKLIENELKEISKIEISRNKLEFKNI